MCGSLTSNGLATMMDYERDWFRDFGLDPSTVDRPVEPRVRASFSLPQMLAQWLGTGVMTCVGLGIAFALWHLPDPWPVPAALFGAIAGGYIVWRGTRLDLAWVELEGTTLRSRHLYTSRERERDLSEVSEIVPVVLSRVAMETRIAGALWGRIKAFLIRFEDGGAPIQICCTDPAMRNARELMQAILFQLSELGELHADVRSVEGSPLIVRIAWRNQRT